MYRVTLRVDHPARAYRHGEAGKGWLLPDGRLLRWSVGRRGDPGHRARFTALKLPEHWDPDNRGGPREGECALAFNITAEGALVNDDWSRGLEGDALRRVCTAAVLEHANTAYVAAGAEPGHGAIAEHPQDAHGAQLTMFLYQLGLESALANAWLRRRDRDARHELPPRERLQLIHALKLGRRWQQRTADGTLTATAVQEVERTSLEASSDSPKTRRFELQPPTAISQPGHGGIAVHLKWRECDAKQLVLRVVFAAERTSRTETRTQVPADTPARVRAALLSEIERFFRRQYQHGERFDAIVNELAATEPRWLRYGAPAHLQPAHHSK